MGGLDLIISKPQTRRNKKYLFVRNKNDILLEETKTKYKYLKHKPNLLCRNILD